MRIHCTIFKPVRSVHTRGVVHHGYSIRLLWNFDCMVCFESVKNQFFAQFNDCTEGEGGCSKPLEPPLCVRT